MVKREEHSAPADDQGKKKKRRNVGQFPCSQCSKVFTRSDHLARHYLNHQPKQVFVCDYLITDHGQRRTCGKTFVRRDLRDRHMRRHEAEKTRGSDPDGFNGEVAQSPLDISNLIQDNRAVPSQSPLDDSPHSGVLSNRGSYAAPSQAGSDMPAPSGMRSEHSDMQNMGNGSMASPGTRSVDSVPYGQAPGNMPRPMHRQMPQSTSDQMPPSSQHGIQTLSPRNALSQQMNSPGTFYNSQLRPELNFQGQKYYNNHMSPRSYSAVSAKSSTMYPSMPGPNARHYSDSVRPSGNFANNPPVADNSQFRGALNPADVLRTGSNMPQSSGDIISWLFMDSPENIRSPYDLIARSPGSTPSSTTELNPQFAGQPYRPQASQQPPQKRSPPNNVPGSLFHNMGDSMLNIGLQDLNYFSNNDNPLDEVFLRSANNEFLNLSETPVPGFQVYSTSSSSPTNTNGSNTPGSDTKSYNSKRSVDDRLVHHSSRVNLEKNKHLFVDQRILKRLLAALPEVTHEKLRSIFAQDIPEITNRLSLYLYAYWEVFHTRFSILHKPSFSTDTAHPFLIFAMIIIGCSYCHSSQDDAEKRPKSPEFNFSMLVAVPLRFQLFQHPEFKSPIKVWILQTLNLLEWSEKNYLLRGMHERAHIHHGTTVQLLHRSPFLGGNPSVTNKASGNASDNASLSEEDNSDGVASDLEENLSNDQALFKQWVESESMKRVTFMTFYLDVIDYIKFRHNPQIPFFQLQLLNLPCDEEDLWESTEVNGSFKKVVRRSKKLQRLTASGVRMKDSVRIKPGMNFLNAMKRLMKSQRGNASQQKLSVFIMNILFGGIASVMHQMQQAELQNSFTAMLSPADKNRASVWKELIMKVLDATEYDMRYSSCSQAVSSDAFFRDGNEQCRTPMYHLIQIIGVSDINHYDIAIFSGSPRNMSVEATSKDLDIVSRKLRAIWSQQIKSPDDSANMRCIIHCYWLLWSLMLSPLDLGGGPITDRPKLLSWDVDHDYYDSVYAVSVAVLVLWCYTYSICGTESQVYETEKVEERLDVPIDYEKLMALSAEDGYQFLQRIRGDFTRLIHDEGMSTDYLIHTTNDNSRRVPLTAALAQYCDKLAFVKKKENISGLCFLVGSKLLQSQWEIARENGKLIINCGLRSIGKKTVQCPDLFTNDFDE